jgi:DNA helicase-2/ATP-dependent DNA helicase PcrA
VSLDELIKMYEKNWQPLGYLNEKHRKERFESGKEMLEDYYKRHKDDKPKHVAIEKPFNVYIGGIRFYGRIDRIDELPDGGVEIIDYKTGNPKTQKDVDKDDQISFYAIGAKEALGLEPAMLSMCFLEEGEKISTTRTEEQLDEKKKDVKEVVKHIKDGDFEATPGMYCNWCDFNEICPFAYRN